MARGLFLGWLSRPVDDCLQETTALIREVTRRAAKNTFLSAEDAEGRGEHLLLRRWE